MESNLGAWTLEISGRQHSVTVDDTGNGKAVLRVDGRMVARPLAEEEAERTFTLDGFSYRVTRSADGTFELLEDEWAPPPPPPSAGAPDFGGSIIGARAILWAFIAVLAISPLVWYTVTHTYSRRARHRVEEMLAGMQASPDQSTIGLWARDTHHLADIGELSAASDKFDNWRTAKGIEKPISLFHVITVNDVPSSEVPTVEIRVVIDARDLVMVVPERRPISWAKDPS